ncbi:ralA-binding protein 1 isoform X2 [Ostrinia nubilalis]|uniref:ralA-binding protein 1 isoform X2 n=1 Tax=Ostrinia nubilalis TaxID=29057 RepID=UPI0030824D6B
MHHLRNVFAKEKEEKAKFKLESKEKLKDEKKEKVKDKDKDKVKEKDKEKVKEKDKEKVKEKDKDKKDKKLTKVPSTVTSGVPFEEIFTLGVALPIFGVPLLQSVERSRCHDDSRLPLVVRDSIDYLQANGLKSNQIYRTEPDKIKLQQLRKLYTDRGPTFPYHWDVPVACAMLKSFISELPDSILTQELHGQFEQATAIAEPQRETTMMSLVGKLPPCNYNLLAWLMRHFESVVANEQVNHASIQTITTAMGPALNMSFNLITYFVTKAEKLFPDVHLTKYVPPLQTIPTDFSECAQDIAAELRKQESLLNQIHAEMHAGFITPARDQQLWEGQRLVTQLKRKLRSVQKSAEPNSLPPQPSLDEKQDDEPARRHSQPTSQPVAQPVPQPVAQPVPQTSSQPDPAPEPEPVTPSTSDAFQNESPNQDPTFEAEFEDNFDFTKFDEKSTPTQTDSAFTVPLPDVKEKEETEVKEKPKFTEKELRVLRLELENAEYLQLKSLLQAKINSEQFEIVKLRSHVALKNKQESQHSNKENKENNMPEELELKQRLMKENALLEQKRLNLINQIFQERVACIQLKIELAMKEILSKS